MQASDFSGEQLDTLLRFVDLARALGARSDAEVADMLVEMSIEYPMDSPYHAILMEAAERLNPSDEEQDK